MKKLSFLFFYLAAFSGGECAQEHFLSFIIPCYNCSQTVAQSIDSIYKQNITIPFEIICTNDASTDNTLEVLLQHEKMYPNLHVYSHQINLGGGAASNTCVSHAKGDLLFRLDSDNALSPGSMNQLIALLDETGCDGATVEEIRYHSGNYIKITDWIYKAPSNICDLIHCTQTIFNPAASGNYLFTRKSFDKAGGYPKDRSGSDTFCFGFKQYATGSKIAVLPNSFYWHFLNHQGYWCREEATGNNQKVALATLLEFSEVFSQDAIKNLLKTPNYATAIQSGSLQLARIEILDCLFKGYEFEAAQKYEQALIEFESAITNGCTSEKIKLKIEKLKRDGVQ
ncbi:MAG: glycosyltransferase family 2 protein [Verrucomicrobia bacterium]|nr:glycosyltransferase family 2 protein [Verrucomicrobiota bacterium]